MKPFKLAYNTNGLRNLSLLNAIKNIAMQGYEGVEISFCNEHIHPYNVTDKQLNKIKSALSDYNIELACMACGGADLLSNIPYQPSLVSLKAQERKKRVELLKKSISIAEYMLCPVVNFASGFKNKAVSDDDTKKYLIEGINNIVEDCGSIILAIEPEPGMYIDTTQKAIAVIKEINSEKLKLNLDIGHVFCSEDDYIDKIKKALDYTVHCHVEDIIGRIHHHEIPGTGDINLKEVFKIFNDGKYKKYISVELYHHADVWQKAVYESLKYLKTIENKEIVRK